MGDDVDHVLFVGKAHVVKLLPAHAAGALGVQDGAAARAGLPGRVHDGVGIARVDDHHNELVFKIHQRCTSCDFAVGQIGKGLPPGHGLDGDGGEDAVAGDVQVQKLSRHLEDHALLGPGGDGHDDALFGAGKAEALEDFAAGGAAGGLAEAHDGPGAGEDAFQARLGFAVNDR